MPPFREPPCLTFDRVANFRDLGGHTTRRGSRVRSGLLYRSGHLAHASDADVLRVEQLGLRCVFDFRTLRDIEIDGADRLPASTRHVRLPMPDPAAGEDIRSLVRGKDRQEMLETFGEGRAALMMVRSAAGLVRERREPYSEFLAQLAGEDSPALFHCSAGKDRAGWAGSLVLLALGVDEEQVVDQYLLSNRETERIRERFETEETREWADLLRPLVEVRREYIESSFEAVREDWGTFERYLHEGLGFGQDQRDLLCERLLE